MANMRVLHLVNWYPNVVDPHQTPFIRRQVEALRTQGGTHEVWHVEVRRTKGWRIVRTCSAADRTLLLECPLRTWYLIEWITFLMVVWLWWTRKSGRFDVVNVHVAYPLLVRSTWLKRMFRAPVVITEHWSAYHFDFHSTSRGLERIRRIFHHGMPIITVSRSLAEDIMRFSRNPSMKATVIDNVVDTTIFHPDTAARPSPGLLFAMAAWKEPKRPDILIEALAILHARGSPVRSRVAGDGALLPAARERVKALGIGEIVTFCDRLEPGEAAREMRSAAVFAHCSDYETYSVVCAEAICCGTPVVASRVGGIPEFVTGGSGWLVDRNTPEQWADVIEKALREVPGMDREAIAARMRARCAPEAVGPRYIDVLRSAMNERPGR